MKVVMIVLLRTKMTPNIFYDTIYIDNFVNNTPSSINLSKTLKIVTLSQSPSNDF
ncbi:MAG: hypothetical protein JJT77_09955 [Crocinitomicaceae bacterium]|nr:hypothetical protein [Crocinitomicaceae bacterium]